MDSYARTQRLEMIKTLTATIYSGGSLSGNWTVGQAPLLLAVQQQIQPDKKYSEFNYVADGCYRSPSWAWYLQSMNWYESLGFMVLFATGLALYHGQGMSRPGDRGRLVVMATLGCISYAGRCTLQICDISLTINLRSSLE